MESLGNADHIIMLLYYYPILVCMEPNGSSLLKPFSLASPLSDISKIKSIRPCTGEELHSRILPLPSGLMSTEYLHLSSLSTLLCLEE